MTDPVVLFFAGLAGLALGSFLNVCVARWPHRASVVRPRSACPACSAAIRWYDQIPVVGWLLLGARCRACRAPISQCYPLVEVSAAAICTAMVLTRGVSLDAAAGTLFLLILLGIALTDARFYLIPDPFSLGGAAAGLALALAPGGITPGSAALGAAVGFGGMWLVGSGGTWMLARARPGRLEAAAREHHDGRRQTLNTWVVRGFGGADVRAGVRPRVAVVVATLVVVAVAVWGAGPAGGLAVVAVCTATVAVMTAWVEGLWEEAASAPADAHAPPGAVVGGGDVKMMALVGAFTGPWGVVLTVFGAALSGSLAYLGLRMVAGTRQLIPFGVFLAAGAATTLTWGDAVLSWYLPLIGVQ